MDFLHPTRKVGAAVNLICEHLGSVMAGWIFFSEEYIDMFEVLP